jgi:hypothetical protein
LVFQLHQRHAEGSLHGCSVSTQNHGSPVIRNFAELKLVLARKALNHCNVIGRGAVLKGERFAGEVLPLLWKFAERRGELRQFAATAQDKGHL